MDPTHAPDHPGTDPANGHRARSNQDAPASRPPQGNNNEFQFITGLWRRTSRSGNTYYSVRVNEPIVIPAGVYLMLYRTRPETIEQNPNAPQLRLVFQPPSNTAAPQPHVDPFEDIGVQDTDPPPTNGAPPGAHPSGEPPQSLPEGGAPPHDPYAYTTYGEAPVPGHPAGPQYAQSEATGDPAQAPHPGELDGNPLADPSDPSIPF